MRPGTLLRSILHFRDKDASYYAGGIAFFLLFSLVPFLLLTLSVAAVFAGSSEAFVDVFDSFARANFPRHAQALRDTLIQVFEHRGHMGLVGLVWIFVSARKLVNAIELGLNAVLEIEKPRSGMLTTLASVAFIFLAALLFLACVLLSVAVDFAAGLNVPLVGAPARSFAGHLAGLAIGLTTSVTLFYGLYRLAPAKGLDHRESLIAAACATLLWFTARHVFVWFAARQLAKYEWLYGSMAGFLMVMLWAYVFSLALLMGACIVRKR